MLDIVCGSLIDGTGGAPEENVIVRTADGRITDVSPANARPEREGEPAGLLDLSDFTVIPGLVDSHDHLGFDMGDLAAQCAAGEVAMSLRAGHNAERILRSGITTLRDVGSFRQLACVWRDALADGLMHGPRLLAAGEWITRTGGHTWVAGRQADGEVDVRRAVREQARARADWIKIVVSGGLATPGHKTVQSGLSAAEIEAAADEAHSLGLPISAHAHGGPGLRAAIDAGVDVIEHATFATREDLALMAEKGTAMVSTFGVLDAGAAVATSDAERTRWTEARDVYLHTLSEAWTAGVVIAVGVDLMHGCLAAEIEALHTVGATPMEALQAATSTGARVIRSDDVGSVLPGKRADLVGLRASPLDDLANLRAVEVVVKDGVVAWSRPGAGRLVESSTVVTS